MRGLWPLSAAVVLNSDFRAAIFFSVAGMGSAAPMLLPGAMTIWRQAMAINAPADQARDVTRAIVGMDVSRKRSRMRSALSTRPPCVLIRTTMALSPFSSARLIPRCTSAAWLPSISPEMEMTRADSASCAHAAGPVTAAVRQKHTIHTKKRMATANLMSSPPLTYSFLVLGGTDLKYPAACISASSSSDNVRAA